MAFQAMSRQERQYIVFKDWLLIRWRVVGSRGIGRNQTNQEGVRGCAAHIENWANAKVMDHGRFSETNSRRVRVKKAGRLFTYGVDAIHVVAARNVLGGPALIAGLHKLD
jgi:hypothetical protein